MSHNHTSMRYKCLFIFCQQINIVYNGDTRKDIFPPVWCFISTTPILMGTIKKSLIINGARKDYIALGPVPALNGPVYMYNNAVYLIGRAVEGIKQEIPYVGKRSKLPTQ